MGVVAREEGGDGKAGADDELMEFFCDGCDVTIPNGVERMECVVCPGEFCFCQACYDAGEVMEFFSKKSSISHVRREHSRKPPYVADP